MKGTGGSEELKSRECWMRRGWGGELVRKRLKEGGTMRRGRGGRGHEK